MRRTSRGAGIPSENKQSLHLHVCYPNISELTSLIQETQGWQKRGEETESRQPERLMDSAGLLFWTMELSIILRLICIPTVSALSSVLTQSASSPASHPHTRVHVKAISTKQRAVPNVTSTLRQPGDKQHLKSIPFINYIHQEQQLRLYKWDKHMNR